MSKGVFKKCARVAPDENNERCDEYFWTGKVHNKIYCSAECCRIQTNANIAEQYHNNKRRLAGEVRLCSQCRESQLSRYNEGTVCSLCESRGYKEEDFRFRFLTEVGELSGV